MINPRRAVIGYHCSHEQHGPAALLANVRAAEQAGFSAAMCSDHFSPFSESQGQSGFAWSWLGAAMQATRLSFGTVTAPGQRYHPAVVAQAAATLCELFPDRFWWALGTGQAINERITGQDWPQKSVRRARLREAVDVIRALFRGETVTHDGLIKVREARLWSRPARPPQLVGAAVSIETAEWVGGWADALITTARPPDELKQVVEAFRRGGGEGKPMYLQVALSWAPTEPEAERLAMETWRTNVLPSTDLVTELHPPAMLDAVAQLVRVEDARKSLRISSSVQQHLDWLAGDEALGFERLHLHQVAREQRPFFETVAPAVLRAFGDSRS